MASGSEAAGDLEDGFATPLPSVKTSGVGTFDHGCTVQYDTPVSFMLAGSPIGSSAPQPVKPRI